MLRLKQKLIAMATLLAISSSFLVPTLTLAAQPRRGHSSGQRIVRTSKHNMPKPKHSIHKAPKRTIASEQHRTKFVHRDRHRVTNPKHHYPRHNYKSHHRFWYNDHCYYHGYYSGYWHNRYYRMHSEDWIAMIGLATFAGLIADNNVSTRTVIVDSHGNVISVIND